MVSRAWKKGIKAKGRGGKREERGWGGKKGREGESGGGREGKGGGGRREGGREGGREEEGGREGGREGWPYLDDFAEFVKRALALDAVALCQRLDGLVHSSAAAAAAVRRGARGASTGHLERASGLL